MSGVKIRVTADTSKAQDQIKRLEQTLGNLDRAASSVNRAINLIGASIAFAFGTDAISRMSDQFTVLENRIALVTGRTKELNTTLDALYSASLRSRGSIQGSVEVFNRFGRALQSAGVSSRELVAITETVQKAISIGGGSAQSAEAAIIQLGQGLAAGQLRGQELNSVLEQAPRLAQAIADSLGQPIGALRSLAETGALTTEVVFEALRGQASAINDEFALANATVSQGLQLMSDQFTRIVGKVDAVTFAWKSLGYFFTGVAETINNNFNNIAARSIYYVTAFNHALTGVASTASGLGSVFAAVFGRFLDSLPRIIGPMRTLSDDIFAGLVFGSAKLTSNLFKLVGEFDSFVASTLGLSFEGKIFALFQSKSLIEFGDNLKKLAESIESYGRRWYNVFNNAERFIRGTTFEIEKTLIYVGLLDQRLISLRYTSFERLYKVIQPIGRILEDMLVGFLSLEAIAPIVTVVVGAFQLLGRVIESFFNLFGIKTRQIVGFSNQIQDALVDFGSKFADSVFDTFGLRRFDIAKDVIEDLNASLFSALEDMGVLTKSPLTKMLETIKVGFLAIPRYAKAAISILRQMLSSLFAFLETVPARVNSAVTKATAFYNRLMSSIKSLANISLNDVLKTVKNFADKVVNFFFWIYDEVIGNSWWTDTMEETYSLANTWLGRTVSKVSEFYKKVVSVFRENSIPDLFASVKLKLESSSVPEFVSNLIQIVKDTAISVAKIVAEIAAGLYDRISEIFPPLGELVSTAVTGGLLAAFAPELFKRIGVVFALGILSSFGDVFARVMSNIVANTRFVTDLGTALGRGAGSFVNTIINSIPAITTAFIRFVKAFGKAFVDELKGAFGIIPQLLSSATFGIFDTLVGAFLTLFGGSVLLRGFSKTVKSMKGILKGAGLVGESGILSSIVFGKDGESRSRARVLSGVLGALTAAQALTGGFYEGGGFASAAMSGGLLAYAIFGQDGIDFARQKITSTLSAILSTVQTEMAKFGASSGVTSMGLHSVINDLKVGNFTGALARARTAVEGFKASVASGQFDRNLTSAFQRMGANIGDSFGPTFGSKLGAQFAEHGRNVGRKFSNTFSKVGTAGIAAAAIAAVTLAASQANAATASVETSANRLIDAILNNLGSIAMTGLIVLSLFGPGAITGAIGAISSALLAIGSRVVAMITTINAAATLASGKGIIFRLLGLGSSTLFRGVQKLLTKRLIATLTKTLISVGARIGAVALKFFSLPGIIVAGTVGLISLMLFGKGDTLGEKVSNFFSGLRSFITGTTLAAREMGRELDGIVSDLPEAAGNIELDIADMVGGINLENTTEVGFRRLTDSLNTLRRVSEMANSSFEENGRLTLLEEQRTQAAIREVRDAVIAAGGGDEDGLGADPVADISGILDLVNLGVTTTIVDDAGAVLSGEGSNAFVNERDNPALFALYQATQAENATSEDQAAYMLELLRVLRTQGVGNRRGEIDLEQASALSVLEAVEPLLGPASRGESLPIPAYAIQSYLDSLATLVAGESQLISESVLQDAIESGLTLPADGLFTEVFNGFMSVFGLEDTGPTPSELAMQEAAFTMLSAASSIARVESERAATAAAREGNIDTILDNLEFINSIIPGRTMTEDYQPLERETLELLTDEDLTSYVSTLNQAADDLRESVAQSLLEDLATTGQDWVVDAAQAILARDVDLLELLDPEGSFTDETSSIVRGAILSGMEDINPSSVPDLFEGLGDNIASATAGYIERQAREAADTAITSYESAVSRFNSLNIPSLDGDILNLISPSAIGTFVGRAERVQTATERLFEGAEVSSRQYNLAFNSNFSELLTAMENGFSDIALLRESLTLVDDPIDETELYSMDQATRAEITTLTGQLLLLRAAMNALQQGGLDESEFIDVGSLGSLNMEGIITQMESARDLLTDLVGGGSGGGGGGESPFDRFVSGMSAIGFDFRLEDTIGMTAEAMSDLVSETDRYRSVQEEINDLAVTDIENRQRLLEQMREIRDTVGEILSGGTFGTLDSFLSGMGSSLSIDDLLSGPARNIEEIVSNTLRLREIEEEINGLTIDQIDIARQLFAEAERLRGSLEGSSVGRDYADSFKDDFKNGLSEALRTGDFSEFGRMLLDKFTGSIIDAFVDGLTEGLFGENGLLSGLFDNMFDFGQSIGGSAISAVSQGATNSQQQGQGIFAQLISSFGELFTGLFRGISGLFSGGFGGGGKGGGGLLGGLLSFLPFNEGGIVPSVGTSRRDIDSVPAMLTPGELVVPADKVDSFLSGGAAGSSQTFNINIQGDVSRQTRAEIVRMIPEITQGVNSTNRENNFRGRR